MVRDDDISPSIVVEDTVHLCVYTYIFHTRIALAGFSSSTHTPRETKATELSNTLNTMSTSTYRWLPFWQQHSPCCDKTRTVTIIWILCLFLGDSQTHNLCRSNATIYWYYLPVYIQIRPIPIPSYR